MRKSRFTGFSKIMPVLMAMILAVLTLGGCSGDKGGANDTPTITDAVKKAEDPTAAPTAEPTDVPATPTDVPATPTDVPADPTDIPADPADDPVDPVDDSDDYGEYYEPEGGRVFDTEGFFHTGTFVTEDLYNKEFCGICLADVKDRYHFFEYFEDDVRSNNAFLVDHAYFILASTPDNSIFTINTMAAGEQFIDNFLEWDVDEDGNLEFKINGEEYHGAIYQGDYDNYMVVSFGDYRIWFVMKDYDSGYDYSDIYDENTEFDPLNTEFDPSNLVLAEDMQNSFIAGRQFYGLCKTDASGNSYFFEYTGWPSRSTVDEFGDCAFIDLALADEMIAAVCGDDHIYSVIKLWYIDEDGLLVMVTGEDIYYAQIYEEPDDTMAVYLALIMGDECYWYKLVPAAG